MINTYFDIVLPQSILDDFTSYLSGYLVNENRLRITIKMGQYTVEKTGASGNDGTLSEMFYGINSTYVEKKKIVKGFEFNSASGEKTLFPHYVFLCLSRLQKELTATDTITVYDYDTLEEDDLLNGVTVRTGKIIDLSWESQSLMLLPSDYYSNPDSDRESGTRLGTIKLLFREASLRNG